MTALAAARVPATQTRTPIFVGVDPDGIPVKGATTILAGAMVALTTAGYLTNASADATLTPIGIANEGCVNGGGDGAKKTRVRKGIWAMANSAAGEAVGLAQINSYCYALDSATVGKTNLSGTLPPAGIVRGIASGDAANAVYVEFADGSVAKPLLASDIPAQSGGVDRAVRGVVTTNIASLAAFTVASADLTFVEGDRVLLTGQSAQAENGIYVVGAVAIGVAALTRPSDFSGTLVLSGMLIQVSEGTEYKDSVFLCTTNGAITIDSTSINFQRKLNGATAPLLPVAADVGKVTRVSAAGAYDHDHQVGVYRTARGVNIANVADLANFTMAATDLTYVAGNRILLVNQTTSAQNGIYVVGADGSGSGGAGTATLTRATDMATGAVLPNGVQCLVSEGAQGAYSRWACTVAGSITVGTTTPFTWECLTGNWVQMSGVTAAHTAATPTALFVAAAQLKARTTGIFRVDVKIRFNNGTTADAVTAALVSCTVAPGTGLASADFVAHGVQGVGAYGTLGGAAGTLDGATAANMTFNGNAWTDGPIVQESIVIPTLTGLLTANGSGGQDFSFSGICHNAISTVKTPFTKGNLVAFGVKFTAAAGTLTFASISMSVHELAAG